MENPFKKAVENNEEIEELVENKINQSYSSVFYY